MLPRVLEETGTQSSCAGTAGSDITVNGGTTTWDSHKHQGVSFWFANPRMAETCEVLVAMHMSHDVFFPCHDEGTQACAYHEGCGTKLVLESNRVFELPVEIVLHNAWTTGKNGNSCLNSSLSELEQIEGMTIAIASSKHPKRLKCVAPCILWTERG